MLVHRRSFRIEWAQCDPAGIVFYPQYLILFDAATGQLFERTGLSASGIRKKYGIVGFPLVECGAKFLLPCHFDDDVTLESFVRDWGRSSFTVAHRVLKGDQPAVEGFETRIWAKAKPEGGIRPEAVPQEVKASLSDPTGKTRIA